MPIFQKKTNFKAPPPRTGRVAEAICPRIIKNEDDDYKNLQLVLKDREFRFVDGLWIQHSTGKSTTAMNVDDLVKLKGKMDRLEQENNLLQIKVDILIDLLTEKMCKE